MRQAQLGVTTGLCAPGSPGCDVIHDNRADGCDADLLVFGAKGGGLLARPFACSGLSLVECQDMNTVGRHVGGIVGGAKEFGRIMSGSQVAPHEPCPGPPCDSAAPITDVNPVGHQPKIRLVPGGQLHPSRAAVQRHLLNPLRHVRHPWSNEGLISTLGHPWIKGNMNSINSNRYGVPTRPSPSQTSRNAALSRHQQGFESPTGRQRFQ